MSEAEWSRRHIKIFPARFENAAAVARFLKPFVAAKHILPRSAGEIEHLMKHAFIARSKRKIVGFSAVEIYSRKLAEIQCLAVDPDFQDIGIGRALVKLCVALAKEKGVQEVMAISASENLFRSCGFDYSLPNQKRALFIQPQTLDLDEYRMPPQAADHIEVPSHR